MPRLLQIAVFAATPALWLLFERLFATVLSRCVALWCVLAVLWAVAEVLARKRPAVRAWLPDSPPVSTQGYVAARSLFMVMLGAIFVIAFWSWGSQVRGLVGERGLEPVADQIAGMKNASLVEFPTLCRLSPGDGWLVAQCWLGVVFALAMAAGVFPGPCALVCWVLYLSLMTVGGQFANFQWDALLLETAPLAAVWLPWSWRAHRAGASESLPQRIGRWLLWWLLIRLMIESGVVKLTWDDETWLGHTALYFHYQTQPLPLWTAWYAHQWPEWFHRASCWWCCCIEIALPALLLAPPRWRTLRHATAITQIALQLAIAATGNYTYFNLLTIALCVPFLDDGLLRRLKARASLPLTPSTPLTPLKRWRLATGLLFALIIGAASVVFSFEGFTDAFGGSEAQERKIAKMREEYQRTQVIPRPSWWQHLRSFNGYGLFRTMTTTRPEIIIEGSTDGNLWREYEFPCKPGEVYRRPALVAPHQPRLDWQMWFAALNPNGARSWLEPLLLRILQGEPSVLALLEKNPFPDKPPQFVRLRMYEYRFTKRGDTTVAWWHRELKGVLVPPISLESFRR